MYGGVFVGVCCKFRCIFDYWIIKRVDGFFGYYYFKECRQIVFGNGLRDLMIFGFGIKVVFFKLYFFVFQNDQRGDVLVFDLLICINGQCDCFVFWENIGWFIVFGQVGFQKGCFYG